MSARMGLHVALCLRLDAIEAHRLANAYRAEVLREAADVAVRAARNCGDTETEQHAASVAAGIGKELRRMADAAGKDTRATGESTQPAALTVYRASHDSITFGLYTTAAAAREHCETYTRRETPTASLDWIEDEEDGVAELAVTVDGEETTTGYVVTALEVAAAYDPDAEE